MMKNVTKMMLAFVMVMVVMFGSVGTVQGFEHGCVDCECVAAPRGPLIPPDCVCDPEGQ